MVHKILRALAALALPQATARRTDSLRREIPVRRRIWVPIFAGVITVTVLDALSDIKRDPFASQPTSRSATFARAPSAPQPAPAPSAIPVKAVNYTAARNISGSDVPDEQDPHVVPEILPRERVGFPDDLARGEEPRGSTAEPRQARRELLDAV